MKYLLYELICCEFPLISLQTKLLYNKSLSNFFTSSKCLVTISNDGHSQCPPFMHGTIIRTGITCKKISCYMRDSACRWFIVKKAKIF